MAPNRVSHTSPDDGATALVAVLPDMVQHGVWDALGRRLAAAAVEIVATTVTRVSPDDVIRLYARNHRDGATGRPPESTPLSIELFSLDATVPVLLQTRLPGVDLVDVIARWKGGSAHGRRHPGDLRSVAPSADRCLSLLHAPDDRTGLRHDGRLLFGPIFDRLLERGRDRSIDAAAVARLRHYCPPAQEPHPWDILLRSIVRGLTLLAIDAHLEPSGEAAAVAAEMETLRLSVASTGSQQTRDAVIAALGTAEALVGRVPPPAVWGVGGDPLVHAKTAALGHRRLELHQAVGLMTRPDLFSGSLADHVEEALLSNDLALDPWERHRLKAAVVFLGQVA